MAPANDAVTHYPTLFHVRHHPTHDMQSLDRDEESLDCKILLTLKEFALGGSSVFSQRDEGRFDDQKLFQPCLCLQSCIRFGKGCSNRTVATLKAPARGFHGLI